MTDWPILSTITFLPLVGALLILRWHHERPGRTGRIHIDAVGDFDCEQNQAGVSDLPLILGPKYLNPSVVLLVHWQRLARGCGYVPHTKCLSAETGLPQDALKRRCRSVYRHA